jgi:hypothetical protein
MVEYFYIFMLLRLWGLPATWRGCGPLGEPSATWPGLLLNHIKGYHDLAVFYDYQGLWGSPAA